MKQTIPMNHLTTSKLVAVLIRVILFAGIWFVIAQGQADAWLIGVPAVILAAMVSFSLSRNALPRLSVGGLFHFTVMFLRESIRGGIDVTRRTLSPVLQIQPGFIRYPLVLEVPLQRVLFVNCVSLLPGTLASRLDEDVLELHLLDTGQDPVPQLRRIEQSIARVFQSSVFESTAEKDDV
jgi:multicomponent Na+:H+ antiporter subunit E